MSNRLTSDFPVAEFAIGENVKGAERDSWTRSTPPRLPVLQASSISPPLFSSNPFSLSYTPPTSKISFNHSSSQSVHQWPHNPFCLSNVPVASNSSDCFAPPSVAHFSCTSTSLSSHAHVDLPNSHSSPIAFAPFQNPFLIEPTYHAPAVPLASEPPRIMQPLPVAHEPRKPLPDRTLVHNPLRPRVPAADRLFSWRTPYGISHDESLLVNLPAELVDSAKMSIIGALAHSTKSTYASGILRFNQFCDRWEISETARMPASYALLCAFIGQHKGSVSGKTIRSWLSGIRAWHLTNHAPWFGDDNWVQMARASANKEGSHHKRVLRAPVSIEHLTVLRKAIDISSPFHAAVWAVALTTFFGCRRLGETTVSSVASFNPRYHVLRSAGYVLLSVLLHLFTN
jgi:hypothetical protein